jgi:hypothetical protein
VSHCRPLWYSVKYLPVVVCVSGYNATDKKFKTDSVKEYLRIIGKCQEKSCPIAIG